MPQGVFFVMRFIRRLFSTSILLCFFSFAYSQENCSNGLDDDGDGLVDLKDPDCHCRWITRNNLLKNPSFELFQNCPAHYSQLDSGIINNWRYGVYRTGQEGVLFNYSCPNDSALIAINYPVPSTPFPDGQGFIHIAQEASNNPDILEKDLGKFYIGQCLVQPLVRGTAYTVTLYIGFGGKSPTGLSSRAPLTPFRLGIFGHASFDAIPLQPVNKPTGCPMNFNGWVQLGHAIVRGSNNWTPVKVDLIIPTDINVILFGPDCNIAPAREYGQPGYTNAYINYLDDIQLSETNNFDFKNIAVQSGNACAGNYVLKAPTAAGAAYQWYRDSIAIMGATGSVYPVPQDSGGYYNVRIKTGNNCETTEPLQISFSKLASLHFPLDTIICKNEILAIAPKVAGIYYEWVGSNKDSIVKVMQPGIYNIVAFDSNGCRRPFTVNVKYQDCEKCSILMPSAFSPNLDGVNDVLKGHSNCTLAEFNMQLYNRWGQKVFESRNLQHGWEGKIQNKNAAVDVYVYIIRYKNSSFESRYKITKGTVLLIR